MKSLLLALVLLLICQFSIIAQEAKETPKPQEETQEEKERREFKEFKEFKEKQNKEAAEMGDNANKNPNEKKWYFYLQGGGGSAATEFEKGKAQVGKIGFEYRISPIFGIGFGLGNNKLNLNTRDTSSGLILAYLLLSAPYTTTTAASTQSAQTSRLLLAAVLVAPSTYNYSYTSAQVDFNFHFNRDKFFDPYAGLGLIAGVCGPAYPCSITGGELKLGTQLNFDSYFAFFQGQAQLLSIKESGIPAVQSQNVIGSLGAGFRF